MEAMELYKNPEVSNTRAHIQIVIDLHEYSAMPYPDAVAVANGVLTTGYFNTATYIVEQVLEEEIDKTCWFGCGAKTTHFHLYDGDAENGPPLEGDRPLSCCGQHCEEITGEGGE